MICILIIILLLLIKLKLFTGWFLALWIIAAVDEVVGIICKIIKDIVED